jgi:hypothetical protein
MNSYNLHPCLLRLKPGDIVVYEKFGVRREFNFLSYGGIKSKYPIGRVGVDGVMIALLPDKHTKVSILKKKNIEGL